jgi:quinohemoprotein ethanol dehydrogenase
MGEKMSFRMNRFVLAGLLGPWLAAAAVAAVSPAGIDDAALANEADGANWAAYGRSFSEQHYSPLRQINASNISRLGLAWSLDVSDSNFATTAAGVLGRSQQASMICRSQQGGNLVSQPFVP